MFRKFKAFRAPKSYRFIDPDTGYTYVAPDRSSLLRNIRNYRSQNGKPEIEYLEAVVDNYLCSLSENAGACEPVSKMDRSIWQTIRGGVALLVNVYYGEENMVDQAEANRRAEICTRCPHNQVPTDAKGVPQAGFAEYADKMAKSTTKGRTTDYDAKLHNCGLCTCPLRAKVHLRDAQMSAEEAAQAPAECWQRPR